MVKFLSPFQGYNITNPIEDWVTTICGTHRKPINRQVKEIINIRKAKKCGKAKIGEKEIKISKEVFNTKEEWYSHC